MAIESELPTRIAAAHQRVVDGLRSALEHGVEVGELLIEAKAQVGHGNWTLWVENHCPFGLRMAQNYLRLARRKDELANAQHVSHLAMRDGLQLLSSGESVHFSSASPEWYTPASIVERVSSVLGNIDLDPCSNGPGSTVPAAQRFTEQDDGLARPWKGRVYMNPPYGRSIGRWTEKLCTEFEHGNVAEAVALVPARPDTEWFARLRQYPRCYLRGRLRFSDSENSAPFPSALFYFGDDVERFHAEVRELGDVYVLYEDGP